MSAPAWAAAGNPMAVPLLVAVGLFVVLLAGLGGAMLFSNRTKITRHEWTPPQRAWRRRMLVSSSVGILLGAGTFIALAVHQYVLGAVLAVWASHGT